MYGLVNSVLCVFTNLGAWMESFLIRIPLPELWFYYTELYLAYCPCLKSSLFAPECANAEVAGQMEKKWTPDLFLS